jgi:hypothetical protein
MNDPINCNLNIKTLVHIFLNNFQFLNYVYYIWIRVIELMYIYAQTY